MIPESLKNELTIVAILYRIHKCNGIPILDDHWSTPMAQPWIDFLNGEGLICISGDNWQLTDEGKGRVQNIFAALDQVRQFEIFSKVYFVGIPDDQSMTDDHGEILPFPRHDCYDPRFNEELAKELDPRAIGEDLRLAMMSYMLDIAEEEKGPFENYSSTRIVFLQKLVDDELEGDFWAGLFSTQYLRYCDDIAQSLLRWEDLAEDQDEAWTLAGVIYEAGMMEVRKINGKECSNCGAPLALNTGTDEHDNDICCSCEAVLDYKEEESYAYLCPLCDTAVEEGAHSCHSCGASFDYGLSPGEERVITRTETVSEDDFYDDDGMYIGYPYYHYDPICDVLAFALVCDFIL